jgi:PTS system nitrogen regulatory IIA component
MALDVCESARLLGVSPDTLRRWARQGLLGMRAPGGELRFERRELEAWARRQGLALREVPVASARWSPSADRPFLAALGRGGILSGLAGSDPAAVLTEMVARAALQEGAPREQLLAQLLAREELGSTGLGHGVALPHPRTPDAAFAAEPTVVMGRLAAPVDWSAVDGEPVHTVLLLLNPTPPQHLQILSRAAFLLRADDFCALLANDCSEAEILRAVDQLEPAGA